MTTGFGLYDCKATFAVVRIHYGYPTRLHFLRGVLRHPTLGDIATMRAVKILERDASKHFGDFLEMMDADDKSLHEMSLTLFDKHSNLRPWLMDGGLRSGSGCWGDELSHGDLLYVQELRVQKEFRRLGVGSVFLQNLLMSPFVDQNGHVLCCPTSTELLLDNYEMGSIGNDGINRGIRVERDRKRNASVEAFYRENGFRRIGLAEYFAYSPKESHPSHMIAPSSDPALPSVDIRFAVLDDDELEALFPIHHAVVNSDQLPDVVQVIETAFSIDRASIHRHDQHGFTPIHFAASKKNVHAVRALLRLDPSGTLEDLKDNRNLESMTPLELLEWAMCFNKEYAEANLPRWDGYEEDSLRCEYLIKKAMGLPTLGGAITEEAYIRKRRFGCTCGMCIGNWLSLRMRFRLSAAADQHVRTMQRKLHWFPSGQSLGRGIASSHPAFKHFPSNVGTNVDKTFFVGTYIIFEAIWRVLESLEGDPPLIATIFKLAHAIDNNAIRHFTDKGGKVEHVIEALVRLSKEKSSLGDGSWDARYDVELSQDKQGFSAEYSALPKCANDLEFELVLKRLWLGRGSGGYR